MSTEAASTILAVTQDPELRFIFERALKQERAYRLSVCETSKEALLRLESHDVDMVIFDTDIGEDPATALPLKLRVSNPRVPRVIVASPKSLGEADRLAKHSAAYLFFTKPVVVSQVKLAVKRALELSELSRRHRIVTRELSLSVDDELFDENKRLSVSGGISKFERLVYASPKMAELVAKAKMAAKTEMPVLIFGETGTGKELMAKAIHFNSDRSESPLHIQNCGGMDETTLRAELFGHLAGAIPGIAAERLGLFRAADGGTVFLDEISEVSTTFQAALLRFLQEGEVKPVGSDQVYHSDVRIIAATNKPLDALVSQNKFRKDLYYRLNGFELDIPPLRDRKEDIGALAEFFLEKYSGVVGRRVLGFTSEVLAVLARYQFPGNVRELETEVQRMVAVAEQGGYISERHLSEGFEKLKFQQVLPEGLEITGGSLKEMVETLEARIVEATLNKLHWNQTQAAQELGLSRVGLANKIKRYNLAEQGAVK
ncbi:MAG: sigma-54 dependent transcriptional regulator [Pseudomonadota bacterium]